MGMKNEITTQSIWICEIVVHEMWRNIYNWSLANYARLCMKMFQLFITISLLLMKLNENELEMNKK